MGDFHRDLNVFAGHKHFAVIAFSMANPKTLKRFEFLLFALQFAVMFFCVDLLLKLYDNGHLHSREEMLRSAGISLLQGAFGAAAMELIPTRRRSSERDQSGPASNE